MELLSLYLHVFDSETWKSGYVIKSWGTLIPPTQLVQTVEEMLQIIVTLFSLGCPRISHDMYEYSFRECSKISNAN